MKSKSAQPLKVFNSFIPVADSNYHSTFIIQARQNMQGNSWTIVEFTIQIFLKVVFDKIFVLSPIDFEFLSEMLLEYWLYTKGLDNLDAPIARKFKICRSFIRFVIFKALIEE